MNSLFFDADPAPTSFGTGNTKTNGQSSSFGNRQVSPYSGPDLSAMEIEPMDTSETSLCSNLTQRRIILSEIQSFLTPDTSEQTVNVLFDVINDECRTLKGHEIYFLSQEEISKFIVDRFKVRSYYLISHYKHASFRNIDGHINTISIFTEFNITTEMAIRSFIHSEHCSKTARRNIFFRAGKFTCVNDEMGRSRNSVLKQQIFDPQTVNRHSRAYGIGLYSTPSIAEAKGYLHKGYNQGNPVTILAISIKPGVNILSLAHNSPFSCFLEQQFPGSKKTVLNDITRDKCHIENCLYIMPATQYGYTLIKSPEIIKKITPYDYTMLTKLFVPFSQVEISGYNMTPKRMTADLQSAGISAEYIKHDLIEINPISDKSYLPIYRYATKHRFAMNSGFREFICKTENQQEVSENNHKFYTTIHGVKYTIRPSARPLEKSRDFSSPEFHVQFKI